MKEQARKSLTFADKRQCKRVKPKMKNLKTRKYFFTTLDSGKLDWYLLYTSVLYVALKSSPKERNLTLPFSWIPFDLMYLPCCRIRFCNNRPVACPHMYLPDCQRRLSRQVYVIGHFTSSRYNICLDLVLKSVKEIYMLRYFTSSFRSSKRNPQTDNLLKKNNTKEVIKTQTKQGCLRLGGLRTTSKLQNIRQLLFSTYTVRDLASLSSCIS